MSVRQVVLCLVSVVGLTGCASYSFTESDYSSFAYSWVAVQTCSEYGHMDADTAAAGMLFMRKKLGQASYDKVALERAIYKAKQGSITPSECRKLSVTVKGWEKQQAQQQQEINELNRAAENFKNSMPKQTYCNRIGTQVFCNTY